MATKIVLVIGGTGAQGVPIVQGELNNSMAFPYYLLTLLQNSTNMATMCARSLVIPNLNIHRGSEASHQMSNT